MNIKRVPIDQVKTWEENPRNIKTEDFERLKKQIKELGVYKPMIACPKNGGYTVLGGNMRLRALKELGIKEVDISIVHPKSKAEKIKYALSDNDRAGEYEEEKLAELVYPYMQDIDLEEFKIDLEEPAELKEVLKGYGPDLDSNEDEMLEIDDTPAITKKGDLFILGKHRLLCGDAAKEKDVERLMGEKKADMVFTDPPYGMNLDTNFSRMSNRKSALNKRCRSKNYEKVIGDINFFDPKEIFIFFGYCKEIFLWGADYYSEKIPNRKRGSWFVWDKRSGLEDIEFSLSEFELCWSKNKHHRKIIRIRWFGALGTEQEDIKKRIHPTQKPIILCEWFINQFSSPKQLIWDGYLGSGTTLIACERTDRICYGMEIDPKYCDAIIKRYSDYTGTPEENIRGTVEHG